MLGVFAWLMPLSVAISTFGSANGNVHIFSIKCYHLTMNNSFHFYKLEKNLKGSLDLIQSPSLSVKIQIIGGKV